MYELEEGGAPPALLRTGRGGVSCYVELYELEADSFAEFVAGIRPPLGLGTLELADGRRVPGFIGEAVIAEYAPDISEVADWRVRVKETETEIASKGIP